MAGIAPIPFREGAAVLQSLLFDCTFSQWPFTSFPVRQLHITIPGGNFQTPCNDSKEDIPKILVPQGDPFPIKANPARAGDAKPRVRPCA